MDKEIAATVKIWSDAMIVRPSNDAGDVLINAFSSILRSRVASPSHGQISLFKILLAQELRELIAITDCWYPGDPMRGSALRTLSVDYDPDRRLRAALDGAGINSSILPVKSMSQTSPGIVKYSFGYGADWREVIIN